MLYINVHHEVIVKKILYKFGMFVSTPNEERNTSIQEDERCTD